VAQALIHRHLKLASGLETINAIAALNQARAEAVEEREYQLRRRTIGRLRTVMEKADQVREHPSRENMYDRE